MLYNALFVTSSWKIDEIVGPCSTTQSCHDPPPDEKSFLSFILKAAMENQAKRVVSNIILDSLVFRQRCYLIHLEGPGICLVF